MRNLLFGVILGLLAVVHSTPLNSMTQDEVYREAVTDGYLIDHLFLTSLTTESPKRNKTVQASQQPSSGSNESDMIEGSGDSEKSMVPQPGGEHYATTTVSGSHVQGSTSIHPVLLMDTDDEGSGDTEKRQHYPGTSSKTPISSTETSTASSTSPAAIAGGMFPSPSEDYEESGSGYITNEESIKLQKILPRLNTESRKLETTINPVLPQTAGHSTPGWIIIVGFIVGVAALIMLCVAIATRDKWNGPSQASKPETKTNSSNQQRELEMETFLHKDKPRENGNAAEYTVIPLDEVPENYSSH